MLVPVETGGVHIAVVLELDIGSTVLRLDVNGMPTVDDDEEVLLDDFDVVTEEVADEANVEERLVVDGFGVAEMTEDIVDMIELIIVDTGFSAEVEEVMARVVLELDDLDTEVKEVPVDSEDEEVLAFGTGVKEEVGGTRAVVVCGSS